MAADARLAEIPAVLDALEAGAAARGGGRGGKRAKTANGNRAQRRSRTAAAGEQRKWCLPDLELGIKASYTTKQWRQRERHMHKRALSSMRSAVAQSVEEHMVMMRRQEEIHALGTNNKAHAIELQLAKLRRENEDLAHRLAKVQQTETEITATNIPSRRSHVKASRDRKRFLDTARRAAQARLERENAQILSRLVTARPSVKPRRELLNEYKHHKKVSRNMCRLAVPPDAMGRPPRGALRRGPLPSLGKNESAPELAGTACDQDDRPGIEGCDSSWQHRLGSSHDPLRRPLSRSTESTYQRACTPGVDEVHAMGGAPRPMSKEEHRAQHAQDRADWSTIRSNEDRGQLCHQLVRIPHVRPGQQPTLLEALLIGFKHPKEADQLLFEVTAGPVTRYAKVSYEAMRLALEDAAVHDQRVVQRGVTLAEAAAAHLRFFGDGATLMLIWQQQGHVLQ